jgi:colanic acid biosynthesis glycosyl transferase WcaI
MGKAQKLETVLKAAGLISKRNPDILFVFIGGGVEVPYLKDLAAQMNLSNVLFLPPRPPSQIGPVLSLADVLLVHLKSDPLFEITIPSKIQAYMAVGKPILVAVPGDASELIEKAKCGLSCPSENPEELVKNIELLHAFSQQQRKQMGENGRQFYADNLSMKVGISRFEQVFSQVINRNVDK